MTDTNSLAAMTVVELRKYAREKGITLSTLTTKAAILERISEALNEISMKPEKATSAEKTAKEAKEPPRRAMIIIDDGEEPIRADIPPQQRPRPDKNKTSTGKVKPAFTLQGSRAWHNPQPFSQNQTQQGRYAPQQGQSGTFVRDAGETDFGAYPPARSRTALPKVSRFGPEATSEIPEPSMEMMTAAAQPHVFRTPAQQTSRQNAYGSGAFRSMLPAQGPAPTPDMPYVPEFPIQEPDLMANETAKENRLTAAIPELLAAGELGDGAGVLEIQPDGYGFLRSGNLLPGRNDVYISGTQIRRFRLRNGDYILGKTRPQRDSDRYAAMLYITHINEAEAEQTAKFGSVLSEARQRRDFDELTPVYPNRRIRLSSRDENDLVLRLIDLFVPVGFGQRAMIVAAPKTGKTTILKKIALSLKHNHPDIHAIMLLVDERPEEVTDLKDTVGGDIFYSTFDEPAESHAKVSELTLERAMRLVESGKDVVILLDSLTRLSRAYNTLMPNSARVMTGGLAAGAMNKPKRFFGAARNLKEGGSLTIIATALVDTGSRMDGVIFEEFKGTGNMELTLDRQLSERRLFPAVSLLRSGTRHEELLLSEKELDITAKVRGNSSAASEQEAISLLLSMLEKTKDNDEFITRYDDWMKMLRNNS